MRAGVPHRKALKHIIERAIRLNGSIKRRFHLKTVITTGLTALLATALPAAAQDGTPQPRLPEVRIQAGMHIIRAEVASTPGTQQMGLMYRQSLPLNGGMLFAFGSAETHCFWMKNTPLPLTIAFIADDGRIVNLADMEPLNEASHCAAEPVRFALEMEQGWFARKGIKAGSQLVAPELFKP